MGFDGIQKECYAEVLLLLFPHLGISSLGPFFWVFLLKVFWCKFAATLQLLLPFFEAEDTD